MMSFCLNRGFRVKLDQIANPGLSKQQVQQEKARSKKRQRAKKAKKKARAQAGDETIEDGAIEDADLAGSDVNEAVDGMRREK